MSDIIPGCRERTNFKQEDLTLTYIGGDLDV